MPYIYFVYLVRCADSVVFFHLHAERNNYAKLISVYSVEHLIATTVVSTVRNKMPQISYSGLQFVKYIVIIILLWDRCFSEEVDPVPPNNIFVNGAFIHLHGYASKGSKLRRQTCWSLLQCAHLCLKYPKCSSFNYQDSEARNGLCELSEESIASNEERTKLNRMPDFVFVQIMRKDLVRFRFSPFIEIFSSLFRFHKFA